jgi:NADH:ubiquinone oxidoreductase subunit H
MDKGNLPVSEFPQELVEGCCREFSGVLVDLNYPGHIPNALMTEIIVAILRRSGHNELVKALEKGRDWTREYWIECEALYVVSPHCNRVRADLAEIDAVLDAVSGRGIL